MNYKPFMVAPFNSGISTYLKPWMQTEDAMTEMQDCFTYRGSIRQRDGYDLYDTFPNSAGLFMAGAADGTTTVFTGTLPLIGVETVGKISLQITSFNGTTLLTNGTDDGAGVITGTNIALGSTINYATGAYQITFTVAPTRNTGIIIKYGIKLSVGNGTIGPYALQIPVTGLFGLPIKRRSVFVTASTAPLQTSQSPFETPDTDGLFGTLTNSDAPPVVTGGIITYSTGAITGLTFSNAVAAGNDIWARWEWQDA